MRIWDLPPKHFCHKHLVAEHRELHGLWNILTIHRGQGGYSRHPETLRWVGKTKALYSRHKLLVKEFKRRGYRHLSPLDKKLATGKSKQDKLIDSLIKQREKLKAKNCICFK